MSSDLTPIDSPSSPFDGFRREDDDGEFWYGRELMTLMGYGTWERFVAVIEKAADSLRIVQGDETVKRDFRKIAKNPSELGGRPGVDYRLTRFAAYLTAMAGDDTKPEVALARVYFAVKTREAEVAPVLRLEYTRLELIELARDAELARIAEEERREQAEALANERGHEIERTRSRVEYMDAYVIPTEDCNKFRDVAQQLGVTESELRNWCVGRHWIYKDRGTGEWKAYRDYGMAGTKWFILKDHPEAERRYGRQLKQTLYITALGKSAILRANMKNPIRPTNLDAEWNGKPDV